MKPLISIITVVYNGVQHIESAMKSVFNQTYSNIEYIIIDGGSTDGTLNIIKRYESRLSFWLSEKDSGIYSAINKGLQNAKGDIVGILNADDWYEKNACERAAFFLQDNKISFCYGQMQYVAENGYPLLVMKNADLLNWQKHDMQSMPFGHPTLFVNMDVYNREGGYDQRYTLAADLEFVLRLVCRGYIGVDTGVVMTNFRMGGATTQCANKSLSEAYSIAVSYGKPAARAWLSYRSASLKKWLVQYRLGKYLRALLCR